MFDYYLQLSVRSFKRNKILSLLMVLALSFGIGACITTLAVLRLLTGNPLPQKSASLFVPELNPLPAGSQIPPGEVWTQWNSLLSYTDASSLMHERRADRQAIVALTQPKVAPSQEGQHPFYGDGVMTTSDFFPMFGVPFQYGTGWSAGDDENRSRVVVISKALNDKLFGGLNSVGRAVRLNENDYRIIGVLKDWEPQPRFYAFALGGRSYGSGDAVFLPLQTARSDQMKPENLDCWDKDADFNHLESAPCAWVSLWVELKNSTEVAQYANLLSNYAHEQVKLGRFHYSEVALPSLMGYLAQQQVVPDDARLQAYLAFGFLLVCVVGTVGLLLAKCLSRTSEIAVRRALGASRRTIFIQFMVESGLVGLSGGLLGLVLAELGLWEIRHAPAQYAHLATLDAGMFAVTFGLALLSSLIAGLIPAWRACVVEPAPYLTSG